MNLPRGQTGRGARTVVHNEEKIAIRIPVRILMAMFFLAGQAQTGLQNVDQFHKIDGHFLLRVSLITGSVGDPESLVDRNLFGPAISLQ